MRLTPAAWPTSIWCLLPAIAAANFCRAATDDVTVKQPVKLQTVAIGAFINGEEITAAALSGSGLLALGTASGRLSIVDRHRRAWHGGWQASADSAKIVSLAFSQDEAAIAAVTGNALLVWRLDDRKVVKIRREGELPTGLALSPGGRFVAVTNFGVSVVEVSSQRLVREFEQEDADGGVGTYESVAFDPDAAVLAATLRSIDAWDVGSGRRLQHWVCKCYVDGVALSRDAGLAVLGTGDGHALVWERASDGVLRDKKLSALGGDHVYGTAVSLQGTLVAAGTASGSVVVWDTGAGAVIARAHPSRQPITRLASSNDGQVMLVEGQKLHYVRFNYDRWLMILKR